MAVEIFTISQSNFSISILPEGESSFGLGPLGTSAQLECLLLKLAGRLVFTVERNSVIIDSIFDMNALKGFLNPEVLGSR